MKEKIFRILKEIDFIFIYIYMIMLNLFGFIVLLIFLAKSFMLNWFVFLNDNFNLIVIISFIASVINNYLYYKKIKERISENENIRK